MRRAASLNVQNQELKIQEVVARFVDTELVIASTSTYTVVYIGEPLDSIVNVQLLDNLSSSVVLVPSSGLSIVNSKDFGIPFATPAGTDGAGDGVNDAIKILSSAGGGSAPGSPALLTSAPFALLANSTITNTGASVITGNLGLYPGTSVVGFPPGTVIGVQHITDAVAQQAQIDATAAYNDLSTRSSTVIPSALDGQVLSAGVYSFASGAATLAASGNGTLTFNGSATDIFVIKTATTLGTGAGGIPTIALTGGALSSNVYWAIGSSATINIGVTSAGAIFRGTVIASASVTVTQGGTVDGRLFALNAAITLSAATNVTVPAGSGSPGVNFNVNDSFILKYISKN